ncbi:hypothetical protein OF83DRAFT_1176535 [Amylostereum chailletii]|nr:hypothetical protein OF83DRAFT_1176535 [Amylostereum chailletii]
MDPTGGREVDHDSINSVESTRLWKENPGTLNRVERWWTRHQPWLEECGYRLRPRYQPDWKPSWHSVRTSNKLFFEYEDGQSNEYPHILDATRISDGTFVTLKRVRPGTGPEELNVNKFLSSDDFVSDPRNHCVAPLEILQVPDNETLSLLVMPLLRPSFDPPFDTFGEVVAFCTQIFEGIQLLHEHHVAHRDCTYLNIMMDATGMYPNSFHPVDIRRTRDWKGKAKYHSRTLRPPKYWLIDFGLSRIYDPANGPALELPVRGGDKSAPEHQDEHYNVPCDPFATDIYYLGNLLREAFIRDYGGFGFIKPLVDDMVNTEPSKRPKIDDVVARFKIIRDSLGTWKLRSRLVRRKEWRIVRVWKFGGHVYRTAGYVLTRKAAIPEP